MAFGNARIDNAPSAGQFGAARLPAVPEAGQFGGIASSGPPDILAEGNLRAWYNLQQSDLVFQDSALTTPAGDDEPIGGLVDWYGAIQPLIQATDANRPTKRDTGGLKYAEFDGVNDLLAGATASVWKVLHGSAGGGIYMVAEWTGTGTNADGAGTFAGGGTNAIGIRLRFNSGLGRVQAFIADGTASASINTASTSWATDTKRVLMAINDAPNTNIIARAWPNAAVTADASGVTYSGSDGAALKVTMGTSVLKVYELVARSPILDATELAALLDYWNNIYGINP